MKGIPAAPKGDQTEHLPIAAGHCSAPGCRLPGSMAASTTGSDERYCRLHFGVPYSEMADITLRSNNRIEMYRFALRWANEPPNTLVPDDVVDTLRRIRRESLLATKPVVEGRPLTLRTLAKALLSQLDAECRDGIVRPATPPAQAQADTWTNAADAAAGALA